MSRVRPFLSGLAVGLLVGAGGAAAGVAWHWHRNFEAWYLVGLADRANVAYQIYAGHAERLASRTLSELPDLVKAAVRQSHSQDSLRPALWLVTAAYEAARVEPPPELAGRLRELPPRPAGYCPKPPQLDTTDAEAIARLEEEWNQAHRTGDVEALDRIWADDLVVTVPEMPRLSKADADRLWRSGGTRFTRYETSEVRIRVLGDAAVVTGRLRRSRSFGGRVADEDWQFTKVYARRTAAWKVVAFHASAAPPA